METEGVHNVQTTLYGFPHREINLPRPVSHKQTEQLELRFSTKKNRIDWVWNKWTAGVCWDWLKGLRLSPFHTLSYIQKCSWNYLCQVYVYTGADMPQNAAAKLFAANLWEKALNLLAEELSTVEWCILFITAWQVKAGNLWTILSPWMFSNISESGQAQR